MPTIPRKEPVRPWAQKREAFGGMKVDNGKFYRSARWMRVRDAYRMANPLCANYEQCGNAMVIVDHIIPISEGGALFDWQNLQSLCISCNAAKTAKQRHHIAECE